MRIQRQNYTQQKVHTIFQCIFLTALVMSAFGVTVQAQEENSLVLEEVMVTASNGRSYGSQLP